LKRIVGLARLLVLEKLPHLSERELYQNKRRRERGRPAIKGSWQYALPGNLKDEWDDEIPDWMEEDQVSNYHTIKIPYGKKYYARKIEKILFTKDLLLNAEWNRPPDRSANLHRHPAFFGSVDDVLHDCCGYCPVPETDEEHKIAQEESKTFISGEIGFLTDNPGRQEIGSFNPITEGDWSGMLHYLLTIMKLTRTEMAYLGSSEGLSQAIVHGDLEAVKLWLAKGVDINKRDHTGRTPLHLAAMASTPEILQHLVDNGARITWRLADGRSALHLAAARGNVEMIRSLMRRSEQNEESEAQRQMQKNEPQATDSATESHTEGDAELISNPSEDGSTDHVSYATGSFVKVKKEEPDKEEPFAADSDLSDPDIYDVNAVEWDLNASPLHLAIMKGHVEAVEELVTAFGADVLLPIKPNNGPRSVNLTLALALALPLEQAKAMTAKLLELGASPAQANSDHKTPLLFLAAAGHHDILDLYLRYDQPAVARAINHLSVVEIPRQILSVQSPLTAAIGAKNAAIASSLLELGARPSISFQEFMSSAQEFSFVRNQLTAENRTHFEERVDQPVVYAAENDLPLLAMELLARGADPNTLTQEGYVALGKSYRSRHTTGSSLLDYVRTKLAALREYTGEPVKATPPEPLDPDDNAYLKEFAPGSYQHWRAKGILAEERKTFKNKEQEYLKALESANTMEGLEEKKAAIRELVEAFAKLESDLVKRGAKTFQELHPDVKTDQPDTAKTTAKTSPFSITLGFRGPDIIGDKRLDYLRM
jgi:ankyrin repeat protein